MGVADLTMGEEALWRNERQTVFGRVIDSAAGLGSSTPPGRRIYATTCGFARRAQNRGGRKRRRRSAHSDVAARALALPRAGKRDVDGEFTQAVVQ